MGETSHLALPLPQHSKQNNQYNQNFYNFSHISKENNQFNTFKTNNLNSKILFNTNKSNVVLQNIPIELVEEVILLRNNFEIFVSKFFYLLIYENKFFIIFPFWYFHNQIKFKIN